MPRVLVTGATGFIGHHLVPRLRAQGDDVVCAVRSRSRGAHLAELGAELVEADVTRPESLPPALRGVRIVYHLAGLTKVLRRREFTAVNEWGTRNLAQACAAAESPPVLVLVSSLAACGPSTPERLRVESDPPAPVSNYGRSKLAGERAAAEFCGQAPITIVRPPIVFGEHDPAVLEMFKPIQQLRLHLTPGYRDQRFSLIHAADLAELLIRAAERGCRLGPFEPGEPWPNGPAGQYFAACDEHPTYADLGRRIAEALDRRVWVVRAPLACTWLVAAFGEAAAQLLRRPAILGLDKAREATAGSWACSDAAARRELGYQPAAALVERLRATGEFYRRERWM